MRSRVATLFIVFCLPGHFACGEVLYESATLAGAGDPSSGVLLQGNQWAGAKFAVDSPILVTGVGGHLTTLRGTLFAAIVPLSPSTLLPSFGPADIESNSLASRLFDNGAPSNDYIMPLSILLSPGNYGLVFGGGEADPFTPGLPFGATGAGRMPDANPTLPGTSLFYASMAGTWENFSPATTQLRFVVEGSRVPEPPTVLQCCTLGLVVAPFYFIRRLRAGKRSPRI
jgi:hypothetical protein